MTLAEGAQRGVIDDPDGYVNVRLGQSVDSEVIAKVKPGEMFTFESEGDADWCKVALASGQSGWMHASRIRLYFTEENLPAPAEESDGLSEIDEFARARGFDYAVVTRAAASGDADALKRFFTISNEVDGAAAESHWGTPTAVYHILGDEKFARFLRAQPLPYRMMVRNSILADGLSFPPIPYLRRHFPETTKALFRREIVGWTSPDERYAIRKTFSDEFDLVGSKVERAELIDQLTGQVLCDLTRDDIGAGPDREGDILWSPDSKRFASLSSDLTPQAGNLFSKPRPAPLRKQTAVYQVVGDRFERVELSLNEPPGPDRDAEIKGAILGHEYTEPVKWETTTVLVLERHEYYEKLVPTAIGDVKFESIHGFGRSYQITITIGSDRKASIAWRLRDDQP